MARSHAKKKRLKLMREGRMNPEDSRSPFAELDLSTRMTKTKKGIQYRRKHKNRLPNHWDSDSFYYGQVTPVYSMVAFSEWIS